MSMNNLFIIILQFVLGILTSILNKLQKICIRLEKTKKLLAAFEHLTHRLSAMETHSGIAILANVVR